MTIVVSRAGALAGELRPPSDKSLTHRAYIFALLARSPSTVRGALRGEDCENTLKIVQALGARVKDEGDVTIDPPDVLGQPDSPLECGNSGTTMRLLAGVLASEPGLRSELVGDESLSRRPMGRVTAPLRLMGADIDGETAPLTVRGRRLNGIAFASPVASAQVKSCLLLAGLRADGETWVSEPAPSRDHTERMLAALGVPVLSADGAVGVAGGATWQGFDVRVPADVSSAAFFMCAAAIVPGSRVALRSIGTNPTRTGVLDALDQAGADLQIEPRADEMGEPVSDIVVQSGSLRPFEIGGALVPRLIDEIPVLAVLATQCEGTTRIRDARELRVKESDRIEAVARNLRAMGAKVETYEDGLDVTGPTQLTGATVDAAGDHRIGMAFAIAGLVAEGETTIANADSIRTSYPTFESDLASLMSRT